MTERLFVAVLGHQNSGKSFTWNTLFGARVHTGKYARDLHLHEDDYAKVFLISGSPEERDEYVGDLLQDKNCRIVLCSAQYVENVRNTLNYAIDRDFDIFIQWLNPGHNDRETYNDTLQLMPWLLEKTATISKRSGKIDAESRVEELRQFIFGWAKARGLTFSLSATP